MISQKAVEPGGIYRGPGGQMREVISAEGRMLTYRLICLGSDPLNSVVAKLPHVGETRTIWKNKFASWALSEVA